MVKASKYDGKADKSQESITLEQNVRRIEADERQVGVCRVLGLSGLTSKYL